MSRFHIPRTFLSYMQIMKQLMKSPVWPTISPFPIITLTFQSQVSRNKSAGSFTSGDAYKSRTVFRAKESSFAVCQYVSNLMAREPINCLILLIRVRLGGCLQTVQVHSHWVKCLTLLWPAAVSGISLLDKFWS